MLQNLKHLFQSSLVSLVDLAATKTVKRQQGTLLIIHLDAIGDYILFRNFIHELKTSDKYKAHKITLCGNIVYREFAESLDRGVFDDFIWIDRNRFRFNVFYRYKFVSEISSRGFETAINPSYSRIFYWGDSVIRASRARERIGNSGDTTNIKGWQKRFSDSFYTGLIPAKSQPMFEFFRNREFFEGILGIHLDVSRPAINVANVESFQVPSVKYAVLFPGAGDAFRQWSPVNFARVAEYLNMQHGLTIIIAGSAGEKELSARITALTGQIDFIDLTGNTTLPELARIISGADVLVSNETGAVHMAVAVGTKVVCISNGNQFGRFSPYPAEVYDKSYYVYPRLISESPAGFDSHCERYRVRSELDINSISVAEVTKVIDVALG